MADVQAGAESSAPPADAPKADAPAAEPKKDAPPPKVYPQAEVDRIVDKVRRNAARDAELRLRREYEARQQQPEPSQKPAPKEEVAPKREDFDTHEEFDAAHKEYVARKVTREELKKRDDEAKERTQREAQEKAAQTWHGRIQQAMEQHEDFETVLETNEETLNLIYRSRMREAITESEIGPRIVYELCKTPAEAKRIAALPGYKQAAEIAKIEDRLTAAAPKADDTKDPADTKTNGEAPKEGDKPAADTERNPDGTFKAKNEPSKAPPPIKPVGGGAAAASNLPSDKDTPEEWRRKEIARINRLKEGK